MRGGRRGRERTEWDVLLTDHHEGYLSRAELERNQRLIADDANSTGAHGAGRFCGDGNLTKDVCQEPSRLQSVSPAA